MELSNKEVITITQRMGHLDGVDDLKFTYEVLYQALAKLTPEQRKQSVQMFPPHNTPDAVKLQPIYGLHTVKELCHADDGEVLDETRSADDFQHHPEQLVLLSDYHPFGDEGDTCYTWNEDGSMTGNVSGKTFDMFERLKPSKEELVENIKFYIKKDESLLKELLDALNEQEEVD